MIKLADGTEIEFVVIAAPSGVGKTTTGDYLEKYQGFTHVDGDFAGLNMHIPECRVYGENLNKAY